MVKPIFAIADRRVLRFPFFRMSSEIYSKPSKFQLIVYDLNLNFYSTIQVTEIDQAD